MRMNRELLHEISEKTRELIKAPTCCKELKESAQRWLDAVGTASEKEQTEKYISELEADIMPIDNLIAFAQSENGSAYFGREKAAQVADHALEVKAAGARFCDCPACIIVGEILSRKEELLK